MGWPAQVTRIIGCLESDGIKTVADLLKRDHWELTDIRNFGDGCLEEVRRVLAGHGLALKGEEVPGGR
jgi:DNA-directed RNA polymerase subunit alpha